MFDGSSSFNQDIGDWDVSNGESFVSIAMNTNTALYESSHLTHNLLLCPAIFVHRLACLKERHHSIKTLVIGMCPLVNLL